VHSLQFPPPPIIYHQYAIALVILVLLEIVVGILGFVYRGEVLSAAYRLLCTLHLNVATQTVSFHVLCVFLRETIHRHPLSILSHG